MPSVTSVPCASDVSNLPGNRKDTRIAPKGSGRRANPPARSALSSAVSGDSTSDKAARRPADPYDSDEEELKDDPLYAPPGKCTPVLQ